MEEIVKAVKNEPNLDNLRHVLISLMAKLQEFKSWRVGMHWIPILEEVVKAVEDVYRNLENLKNVLISLLAELQVVESWNM